MTTLVLLPGMDGTGTLFGPLLRALGSGLHCQVIRYPADEPLTYDQLTALVQQQLPAGPFVLLGESFSGPIAIAIAATRPAGLRGLVLTCSFASNPRPAAALAAPLLSVPLPLPPLWLLASTLLGRARAPDLEIMLRQALAKVAPGVLRRRLAEVLAVDAREQARQIAVPLLYLQADDDRLVPRSAWNVVKSALPGAELQAVAGPHMLLQANPAECAAAIRAFVARAEKPSEDC